MAGEPVTYELFRSSRRSAVHLEMRDSYTPDDPDRRDEGTVAGRCVAAFEAVRERAIPHDEYTVAR